MKPETTRWCDGCRRDNALATVKQKCGPDAPIHCVWCGGVIGYVPYGAIRIHRPDLKYWNWCHDCANLDRERESLKH